MKYFSMFSGIGGFELGIGSRAECIGTSEIDKYAIQVYEKHYGGHKNYGNATTIIAEELPDFDLLVGGFPCQSFSIAGKRKGFEDTRGTLFFDIARIIKVKRPKIVWLENVKGLLNHDTGQTFRVILQTLSELGYDVQWQVLNSKNFGVPQNRERVFIIGHIRGSSRPKVFPFRESNGTNNDCGNNEESVYALTSTYAKGGRGPHIKTHSLYPRSSKTNKGGTGHLSKDDGTAYCLDTGNMQAVELIVKKVIGKVKVRKHIVNVEKLKQVLRKNKFVSCAYISEILCVPKTKVEHWFRSDDSFDKPITEFEIRDNKFDQANSVYMKDGLAPTITTLTGGHQHTAIDDGYSIRRLTPRECERLQGFPDDWTIEGTEGLISDSQRYKMCGNAVTVNVIRAVAERLLK